MDAAKHMDEVRVTEICEKLDKSSLMTTDKMDTYHGYVKEGKDAARQGNMSKSLELFQLAYKIHPSDKLKGRIQKLKEAIKEMEQQNSEDEFEDFVNVNNCGLMLFKDLYDKLYDYQKEGVAFLYGLYGRKGGILADDMGLGKTIQVISFLSGMYDAELVKHALLVMPTSLIKNWVKEFAKWTPGMRVKEFHGSSKTERNRNLEKIQRRGGVIITTYQMLINNWELLASYHGGEFKWDYVILDEAHKIKTSSTKTAKSASAIPAQNRLLLTGTPVQNNLKELWALFDFACHGALLGTAKTFKTEYDNPITRAREKDATPGEKALGLKMSENLMTIIDPYFLRRTKAEVQRKKQESETANRDDSEADGSKDIRRRGGAIMPTLTRKNDFIIWTYLSPIQEDIYNKFLSLDQIKELLMTTRSPLAELNILKKLCDHPRLLSARAVAQLGLEEGTSANVNDENASAANMIDNISDKTLISESGKLRFLVDLLLRLKEEGHRTLVFSQSRKMLDIMERVLVNMGFKVMRVDGTVIHLAERERRITVFQSDKRYSVFLLTTQVGGVGITLTAADRVVIFDPSWNPATDAQAVDRAYRIGQKENVIIYRLITCGTVEEKIYRRQVFKDSLIRQTTGDKKNPFRYFSRQELKELFTLQDTRSSSTQLQLQSLHSTQRCSDPQLDEHIAYLHTMEMFGISDHDLMFSNETHNQEDHPEDQESHQYIENRVQKAHELMIAESDLHKQLKESIESSTEPAWLRKPPQNTMGSTERKPKGPSPGPNPPSPKNSFALVDLTQTGSRVESNILNLSDKFVDLTVDESIEDPNTPTRSEENNDVNYSMDLSPEEVLADNDALDDSVQEVIDESFPVKEGDMTTNGVELSGQENATSPAEHNSRADTPSPDKQDKHQDVYFSSELKSPSLNHPRESSGDARDLPVKPLKNHRLSMLQTSNISQGSPKETPSKVEDDLEFLPSSFNLKWEDSASDASGEEPEENQGGNSGFALQMDGSYIEGESPAVKSLKENNAFSLDGTHVSDADQSVNDSFIHTKKKNRAALIYDSEEDEEGCDSNVSELDEPFKGLGSSTPKLVRTLSTPSRVRKSFGGNTSVASRRSFVESVIEDIEDLQEDMDDDDAAVSNEHSDGESNGGETNGTNAESLMEEEEEEPSGETPNTENDESEGGRNESMNVGDSETGEDEESMLEESTSDPELASSERMDHYTAKMDVSKSDTLEMEKNDSSVTEGKTYESLVKMGKQCYTEGKLGDALSCFLRALDIQDGDPEIQLLTIQLYRKIHTK
ncbi:DNA excision repair protein ERCC-6-like [Hypomesus transpacificus]|uniref:DNA excision repair protein ERCC-6-like n=1 Tax=Hypomesus transpacificus TaxID=137520 RepID=UPI001F084835|nr:DNA excision repair protein ERCC-6-like [Hypomesus transpacificus]